MNELQAGSPTVAGLPSTSPLRMAVTGRHELKTYLDSHEQMAASARATFNSANSRAFWASVFPRAAATSCAMLFQWPGGVPVPAPSAQKSAMRSCSGVREDPSAAPKAFTSAYSSAYWALSRAGGPAGRKWTLVGIANGVTNPHCGSW